MAALDGLAIAGPELRHQRAARPPLSGREAMDWDDVRVFLAVARGGSMRAAGRALGLSQPTLARRLGAREADMALRHQPPESGDYYVAKLGTFAVALYRRRGADTAAWVAYTEEQAQGQSHEPARWVERQIEATGNAGGAARLNAADACRGNPRRYRPRRHPLLYRRRTSAPRAADPADPRACRHLLDDRPPRSAPHPMRA